LGKIPRKASRAVLGELGIEGEPDSEEMPPPKSQALDIYA
jgi:hypothetical protein